ncbi:MAG: hypoxanthine phosphoribosyltransferase, partial [Bacteroidales bacterium]|nr:hypoxanthine phosphoribosyltransferase [Bacteroidales bacterium]
LKFSCELASIRLSSYEGTKSTGEIKEVIGLNLDLTGRTVIIVEDIVDTGATIAQLVGQLKERGASDVRVCTFSLKTDVYKRDIKIDYMGLEIANKFIVGWGLDYDQMGRQLADIYILKDQLE